MSSPGIYRKYFEMLITLKGYEIFGIFIAYAITILACCWSVVATIYNMNAEHVWVKRFEWAVKLSGICYGCGVLLIVASSIAGLIACIRRSNKEAIRGFACATCLSIVLVVAYFWAYDDFL